MTPYQSRTYNNGKILEYIYTVVPKNGSASKISVFIDVLTGDKVDPKNIRPLNLDYGSEDKFKGVCCEAVIDICDGWITETEAVWVTDAGLCWALAT